MQFEIGFVQEQRSYSTVVVALVDYVVFVVDFVCVVVVAVAVVVVEMHESAEAWAVD